MFRVLQEQRRLFYFTSLTLFSSAKERKRNGLVSDDHLCLGAGADGVGHTSISEEFIPRYRFDRSVKALKEVLPSVQALLQDTEERVVASRLSGDFLDLHKMCSIH
ncbi:hypothetical protein OIU74_024384 [Salix koriyanagi]|uniref:Uncharacterized protein n=1 Tax=Salix koriyanagi TaxID=2511006 RepID=A0A9Q0W6R1_9ROSI|nr:hypothetical protein OIU74_024384 [Salix koriyanagi]